MHASEYVHELLAYTRHRFYGTNFKCVIMLAVGQQSLLTETQAQFLLHSTLMYTCITVLTQLTQATYASTHSHHCTHPIPTTAHNPYSPLHTTHGTLSSLQVLVGVKLCLHFLSLSSVPVQSMFVCRKSFTLLYCNQCSSARPRPSCRHKT